MIDVDRDSIRRMMLDSMRDISEHQYAAGWIHGLGDKIRAMAHRADPEWLVVAYLAEGWPEWPTNMAQTNVNPNDLDFYDWRELTPQEIERAREMIVRTFTVYHHDAAFQPTRRSH